jgi:hypothetical protein
MTTLKRQMIDWCGIQKLGWPNSDTTTERWEQPTILRSSGSREKGTFKEWHEPNLDPFPRRVKFRNHRNSHPVWPYAEVIAYFEAHGLKVNQDA